MMVGVDDSTGFYYVILSLLSNILWMITINVEKKAGHQFLLDDLGNLCVSLIGYMVSENIFLLIPSKNIWVKSAKERSVPSTRAAVIAQRDIPMTSKPTP